MDGHSQNPHEMASRTDDPAVFALRDRLRAAVPADAPKPVLFSALQELLVEALDMPKDVEAGSAQDLATRVLAVVVSQVDGKNVTTSNIIGALALSLGFMLASAVKDGKEEDALGGVFSLILSAVEKQLQSKSRSLFGEEAVGASAADMQVQMVRGDRGDLADLLTTAMDKKKPTFH